MKIYRLAACMCSQVLIQHCTPWHHRMIGYPFESYLDTHTLIAQQKQTIQSAKSTSIEFFSPLSRRSLILHASTPPLHLPTPRQMDATIHTKQIHAPSPVPEENTTPDISSQYKAILLEAIGQSVQLALALAQHARTAACLYSASNTDKNATKVLPASLCR